MSRKLTIQYMYKIHYIIQTAHFHSLIFIQQIILRRVDQRGGRPTDIPEPWTVDEWAMQMYCIPDAEECQCVSFHSFPIRVECASTNYFLQNRDAESLEFEGLRPYLLFCILTYRASDQLIRLLKNPTCIKFNGK